MQRKLVYGYIYNIEKQLKSYSTIYEIPSSIIKLCFSFYYKGDGHIKRRFKTVLLGATSVGKSSMMTRFVDNDFDPRMESTIGAAFRTNSAIIDDYTIKYEIWDTAGQERFRSLAPMYYRGAQIAIIVFDVTNKYSFERAKFYMMELESNIPPKDVVIGIAANKCELKDDYDVDMDQVKKFAKEKNAVLMMTSAKLNVNVVELFEDLGM